MSRPTASSAPHALRPSFALGAVALAAAMLAACATAPAPGSAGAAGAKPAAPATTTAAASSASAPAGAASAPARPPAPGTPPPFADVTREAKSSPGFLTLWTRDEKTWLEIPPERLDRPFFFGNSLASGLGSGFFLPGLTGGEHVVVLRRVGNTVQMVARNLLVRAQPGTPLAQAVAESYSDSLLASAPLAAAPHPQRKSLLVDAQALLGGDLVSMSTFIERSFRVPYVHDRGNSSIERMRTGPEGTTLTLRNHYMVPKLPLPPQAIPGGPPPNPALLPSPPRTLADSRSFFVSVAYTLAPLPAQPMKARRADQRVGYFTDSFVDFDDEHAGERRSHIVQRWRLEKKDPDSAVSEPKEPIRVVMDRNIPERWRPAVREGILEWNKAFERAGFRNALVVEQQPANADWASVEGLRLLAVRWFAMDGPGATAVGPSQSDPRTGEILRGAAIVPENWARIDRATVADTAPRVPAPAAGADTAAAAGTHRHAQGGFDARHEACTYADEALEQAAFGLELLSLRGEIAQGSADAERYIAASLKAVVTHEVGHVLGLRHNFKASHGIAQAQLRDRAFTSQRGISNSVMDYNPPNVALADEPVADIHMPGLGAYDYWAIEYGYREYASAAEEAQALARLAAQGDSDPALAFATDGDASADDPTINRFDLGDDALAFARRQLVLARELWARTQQRALPPGDTMEVYRRNLQRGLGRFANAVGVLTKYVGGAVTSRATAGADKPLVAPVPAARQREALAALLDEVFTSSSFRFQPRYMSRLGVDRHEAQNFGRVTDFSLGSTVLNIQRSALDALMSDGTAQRLADAETKVSDPGELLGYAEVQERLAAAVWSEIAPPAKSDRTDRAGTRQLVKPSAPGAARTPSLAIDTLRRNLQREHLRRLAGGVLRPTSPAAADVRAVHRQVALELEASLKAALQARTLTPMARAHLADSLATLGEALKAPLNKQGV
ncbi:MAG: zinc-dependent metalloprotease [Betaproteobacteria bacterium]|nr:zinc-dependent metalloprotease [Betaproteobacteria bacterium]